MKISERVLVTVILLILLMFAVIQAVQLYNLKNQMS